MTPACRHIGEKCRALSRTCFAIFDLIGRDNQFKPLECLPLDLYNVHLVRIEFRVAFQF